MLLFKIGGELTEACGPGMPGPYWVVKGKQSATGRGGGGVKTPPYDVNPVNVQCKRNKNDRLLSRQQKSPVRFGILRA
jgi:hypothetical protein